MTITFMKNQHLLVGIDKTDKMAAMYAFFDKWYGL